MNGEVHKDGSIGFGFNTEDNTETASDKVAAEMLLNIKTGVDIYEFGKQETDKSQAFKKPIPQNQEVNFIDFASVSSDSEDETQPLDPKSALIKSAVAEQIDDLYELASEDLDDFDFHSGEDSMGEAFDGLVEQFVGSTFLDELDEDLDEEYEHSAPKGEQFRAFFGEVQEQVEVNNTKAHDAGHDRQQMLFMNGLKAITGSRGLIGAAN